MERIKQALELARQEREKNAGNKPVKAGNVKGSHLEIEYTQTRTVNLMASALREKRIILDQNGNLPDVYRLLRTQILQRLEENNWNTLAITSPNSGSGKTVTAINLAISLAREVDKTVLLVDANLRSPAVHHRFDFYVDKGLSDYLGGDVQLNEIMIHPEGIQKMSILPAGHALSNSSEMLSSPKMAQLVNELKHRYVNRIVLFDLPPLLESSDALAFIPNVDATLMVIEDGGTKEDDLRQAFELLKNQEVIGTVLNKSYTRDRDYGNLSVNPGLISQFLNRLSKQKLPGWLNK